MSCITLIPNGAVRTACLTSQPTNLIPMIFGTSFANYAAIQNVETWRALIQETLKAYPTLAMRNVAVTKPATVKETDGSGTEVTTRLTAGGAIVNLKTSHADFKEMLAAMQGGMYSIVIGLGSNKVLVTEKPNGELVGFTGQVTAIPTGMPSKDAKLEEFQLDINWDDVDEWKTARIIQLPIFLKELNEKVPSALDVQIKTALSGSTMTVLVTDKQTGLPCTDVLTSELDSYNIATPTAVPVHVANGEYTVTVQKNATPLVAGDYINYRLAKKTSSIFNKLSGQVAGRLW